MTHSGGTLNCLQNVSFHFVYLYKVAEKVYCTYPARSCKGVGWWCEVENDNNYVLGKTVQQQA